MSKSFLVITALILTCDTKLEQKKLYSWMENQVLLSVSPKNSTLSLTSSDDIPEVPQPFILNTALKTPQYRINSTEDEVITDEDVAGDDDESTKVNTAHYDGKKTTITISTEAGIELYQHWLDQAVSGLMAAIATEKLARVSDIQKAAHNTCTKSATTVQAHAKCVVVLLDIEQKYQRWTAKFGNAKRINMKQSWMTKGKSLKRFEKQHWRKSPRPHSVERKPFPTMQGRSKWSMKRNGNEVANRSAGKETDLTTVVYIPDDEGWVGSFRMRAKRSVEKKTTMMIKPIQKSNYNLLDESNLSPMALVAKKLIHTVRTLKNKTKDYIDWQKVIGEIRAEGKKLKEKEKAKKILEDRFDLFKRTLRDQGFDKKLIQKMDVFGKNRGDDYNDDDEINTMMVKAKKKEKQMTDEEIMMMAPVKLIREGMKLGMMLSGQNVTGFDRKNLKMISPRLLSLVPDQSDDDTINLLSPSLFALHDQGKGIEDELSLAKALKYFDEQGHQEWLNFVIEAAGVTDILKRLRDMNIVDESRRMDEQFRDNSGKPMYFTKENVTEMFGDVEQRKIEVFENLQRSFTPQQQKMQSERGFSIMTVGQMELIYGENSPYNSSETLQRLRIINESNAGALIEKEIRQLAEVKRWKLRQHDIVRTPVISSPILIAATPLLSQPVILSPLVFSPSILTPAVLGPVILGPWVFIPVILSPRVLAPLIVNPLIFSPIILSPLVLHPLILSPGIFNPLILSPLLLSPLILSPQVFTPLILTPFVLNPIILTPAVGSPLILSPFVLSPIILSSQVLFGVIFSPHVLSPLIATKLILNTVVGSPSWLS